MVHGLLFKALTCRSQYSQLKIKQNSENDKDAQYIVLLLLQLLLTKWYVRMWARFNCFSRRPTGELL
jgi:hypothetical protein